MNWTFLATQIIFNLVYLTSAWMGVERWGLEAVGAAFTGAYFVLLAVQWGIARQAIGFRTSRGGQVDHRLVDSGAGRRIGRV